MSPVLRRHGTTLALLVLALGVGGVMLAERGAVTTGEAKERRKNLLPAFRGDDVTELAVRTGGRAARIFRGAPDDAGQRPWQIEIDGATGPAEEMAVDQLLGSLREGFAERKIRGEVSADERRSFGLDPPRGEIAVAMGKQRYRVLFGGPASNAPAGAVWAEVEGHWDAVITASSPPPSRCRPTRSGARRWWRGRRTTSTPSPSTAPAARATWCGRPGGCRAAWGSASTAGRPRARCAPPAPRSTGSGRPSAR